MQVLLLVFGGGGVVSAIIAIYKLRPDVNSQAVVQAQGANEIMSETINTLRKELEEERHAHSDTRKRLYREREANQHLREMLVGSTLFDLPEADDEPQSRSA